MWTAIAALQRTDPDVLSVIYTGDIDASKGKIIAKVKVKVAVTIKLSISSIYQMNNILSGEI